MTSEMDRCFGKHTWVLSIALMICITLFGIAMAQSSGKASTVQVEKIEERLRMVEMKQASVLTKLDDIAATLERIESSVKPTRAGETLSDKPK